MTIKERMEAIKKLERGAEIPWEHARFIGKLSLFGSQVCIGKDTDFAELEDMQKVTAWMVEQFGLPPKKKV